MPFMTLDGVRITVNPDDIRWNFKMKITDSETVGGKVIQVLGTTLSDITVAGNFGRGDRSKGDTEAWESEIRFRNQIEKWASRAVYSSNTDPLRFTYPPRDWDFQVFVKAVSATDWRTENVNPRWTLTLFPSDDRATAIVRGVKDLYLKRLMEGVGWKQSEYNGPSQSEVDAMLNGATPYEWFRQSVGEDFTAGTEGRRFGLEDATQ